MFLSTVLIIRLKFGEFYYLIGLENNLLLNNLMIGI